MAASDALAKARRFVQANGSTTTPQPRIIRIGSRQSDPPLRVPDEPKPDKPCWTCKFIAWWQRSDGVWVCGVCHPSPEVLRRAFAAKKAKEANKGDLADEEVAA